MIWSILLIVVGLGFTGYRLLVSGRARRAHQAGDQARARQLVSRYGWLTVAWLALWLVVVLVLVIVVIVKH